MQWLYEHDDDAFQMRHLTSYFHETEWEAFLSSVPAGQSVGTRATAISLTQPTLMKRESCPREHMNHHRQSTRTAVH